MCIDEMLAESPSEVHTIENSEERSLEQSQSTQEESDHVQSDGAASQNNHSIRETRRRQRYQPYYTIMWM